MGILDRYQSKPSTFEIQGLPWLGVALRFKVGLKRLYDGGREGARCSSGLSGWLPRLS